MAGSSSAVVFVTMGVAVNARTAFSLLFPPLLAEFGWDQSVTAGAFSFGFLVSAALRPVLGRLMDRYGPRVVIEAGVLLMARRPAAGDPGARALATLRHARRAGQRRQRLPRLQRPVTVPAQLVRAPARAGDEHRLFRRRRRLDRAAARGAGTDPARRLARSLPGPGAAGAGSARAAEPAAAAAAGGPGPGAGRRRALSRAAASGGAGGERGGRRLGRDRLDAAPRAAHRALLVAGTGLFLRAVRLVRGAGAPDEIPAWRSASVPPWRPGPWASSA